MPRTHKQYVKDTDGDTPSATGTACPRLHRDWTTMTGITGGYLRGTMIHSILTTRLTRRETAIVGDMTWEQHRQRRQAHMIGPCQLSGGRQISTYEVHRLCYRGTYMYVPHDPIWGMGQQQHHNYDEGWREDGTTHLRIAAHAVWPNRHKSTKPRSMIHLIHCSWCNSNYTKTQR